jgi:hypothetical protein
MAFANVGRQLRHNGPLFPASCSQDLREQVFTFDSVHVFNHVQPKFEPKIMEFMEHWMVLRHFETYETQHVGSRPWLSRPGMTSLAPRKRVEKVDLRLRGYSSPENRHGLTMCDAFSSGKAMGVSRSVCRTLALETP